MFSLRTILSRILRRNPISRQVKKFGKSIFIWLGGKEFEILFKHPKTVRVCFIDDFQRFMDSSITARSTCYDAGIWQTASQKNLEAVIVVEYHRLEKSLSMTPWIAGRGIDAFERLVSALEMHHQRFGESPNARSEDVESGVQVAIEFTRRNIAIIDEDLTNRFNRIVSLSKVSPDIAQCYGSVLCKREEQYSLVGEAAQQFISSRRSTRAFCDEVVNLATIQSIVRVAVSAPSVCNRQAWKVVVVQEPSLLEKALSLQNGNAGFRGSIHNLFVVLVDLSYFLTIEERNQPWIEGGLFSMNLMLSLKAHGYGSCALNWCADEPSDASLRSLLSIDSHYIVIMMIAFGNTEDETVHAASPRRSINSFMYNRP